MTAFFISTLLFTILLSIGFSIVPKQIVQKDSIVALLISPVIGLSILASIVFSISRIGIAIQNIEIPIFVVLSLILVYSIIKAVRHVTDTKVYLKIAMIPVGVSLSSWPIFLFGFNWVSYFNDDMTNYVLGATRFFNFGFNSLPMSAFYEGKDYSQAYYYLYSANGIRSGSELYLSVVSLLSKGEAMPLFMTALLSVQMILLSTTLLLTRIIKQPRKHFTKIVYFCCIASPLFSLGFLYQLFGQLGGLSFGMGIIAVVTLLTSSKYKNLTLNQVFILTILFTAQCIWYPEFLPFLAPSFIFLSIWLIRNRPMIPWGKVLAVLVAIPVILNVYLVDALKYGFAQVTRTTGASQGSDSLIELFPFFLKPHGVASLLGFQPTNRYLQDPWESLTIVGSFLLLIAIIILLLRNRQIGNPVVGTFVFMFLSFIFLVGTRNAFGSFKLAMFIQPFLIVSGVLALSQLTSKPPGMSQLTSKIKKYSPILALMIFLVLNFRSLQYYVLASTGASDRGFSEIQQGSRDNLDKEIKNLLANTDIGKSQILTTSFNLGLLKGEAIAFKGFPLIFPGQDVFVNIRMGNDLADSPTSYLKKSITTPWGINRFAQPRIYAENYLSPAYLISNDSSLAINRSHIKYPSRVRDYQVSRNPQNTLIFVNSSQGQSYSNFGTNVSKASIFQPELNPMQPQTFMQGIGKDLLFEVVNPSESPVLIFAGTNTVIQQYLREFLPTYVYSKELKKLPLVGRGSMRVEMPLRNLLRVNGRSYFQIHVGTNLSKFPSTDSLISKIYGQNIQIDNRKLSLFLTNISVLDQSQLEKIAAPSAVSTFPNDLKETQLVYSGVYEDGWIGSNSYFDLSDESSKMLVVEGAVPILKVNPGFKTSVTLRIDGKKLITKDLKGGNFSVSVPWFGEAKGRNKKRVSIQFSEEQKLPAPDGRLVSAQVSFIGFK
jgi:hypothetical protein